MAFVGIIILMLIAPNLFATEVINNSGVFVYNGAIWYKAQVGENWQKLTGSNVKLLLEPTFNTSKGQFPVKVEKNLPVLLSNNAVGKAATGLLKSLPAIGTAITLVELACDLNKFVGIMILAALSIPHQVFVLVSMLLVRKL